MLCSNSVQEAHDLALISHAATLESRIPFLHFFDGFRTSHEVGKIDMVDKDVIRAMISEERVLEHRARGLTPDRPVLRGTAQNPDCSRHAKRLIRFTTDALTSWRRWRSSANSWSSLPAYEYHGAPDAGAWCSVGSGCGGTELWIISMLQR
jgi:pyruvate-ferredoxin/flavodoxin oxidoreductase